MSNVNVIGETFHKAENTETLVDSSQIFCKVCIFKTMLKTPQFSGFIEKSLDANTTTTPLNTPFSS